MPLVRSWWLGKKKGKEAYVVPTVVDDVAAPGGRRVEFSIGHDPAHAPTGEDDGTVGRTGAECLACGTAVALDYVRSEGRERRLGQQLMAVVAEGEPSARIPGAVAVITSQRQPWNVLPMRRQVHSLTGLGTST